MGGGAEKRLVFVCKKISIFTNEPFVKSCYPCSMQSGNLAHRFNELHARVCFGEITSKKTERIVMIL